MGKPRRTKDGIPFRYTFIDEPGRPYYDESSPGPFVMSAVITDDPANAFRIIDSIPRNNKGRAFTGEHKHSHASQSRNEQIIEDMEQEGAITFVTSLPIPNIADYPKENATLIYQGVLSRLLANIADKGPDGIYRIYVDDSDYLRESDLLLLSKAAFYGREGKQLAMYSPTRMYDSEFCVSIQLADTTVGEYRRALIKGDANENAQRRKIVQVNRKPNRVWARPTPGNSMQDSRIRVTKSRGAKPHPSESWQLGNPRPVKKHWWSRI